MLYCKKCQILTKDSCPRCGRSAAKLRTPEPGDPVFLMNCRMPQACMIEPVLQENSIPYSRTGALGAALSTALGSYFELYSICVPYALYETARSLIIEIFGEDEDIMARVSDYDM